MKVFVLNAYTAFSLSNTIEYYVNSDKGNDMNNGSINFPFLTIQKSQETIQNLITNNQISANVNVNIANGVYYGPLLFKNNDFSTKYQISYIGESVENGTFFFQR